MGKEEYCSTETTARLTYEEENVVRYIGGYVLRALKKDPSNKDVSNILHKMIDRTPLQECPPSQTWVNSLDRGGLTKITDEAFQLFYAIETVVRQFFKVDKTKEMDDMFRKRVIDNILSSDEVLFSWCFIADGDLDDSLSEKCLSKIISKWVTIRGFSFANSMIEMYKQHFKKGTEKSKPLRSTVFTDKL